MPSPRLRVPDEPRALAAGLRRLRDTLGVPGGFPADVLAEADAAAKAPRLPTRDCTDVEFVTLDPAGSMDLDQAFHLSRTADGYLFRYAIADVAAFVTPSGRLDAEAHARGETLYAPNHRIGLHPPVLSEGAASLLPGEVRPALVWELELDASGATTGTRVERGLVRSRAKLDYVTAQAALDAGTASGQLQLLREIGTLRRQLEVARGGVSLSVPEQEIVAQGADWSLAYRATLPVEDWNAQLSLATGMAAAKLMLDAGVGILRTLPPAKDGAVERLRRIAKALQLEWPRSMDYPDFVRSLDPSVPAQAAMLNSCTTLFRGAAYAAFTTAPGEVPVHAAIAAPYAHVTAPLRRLVDRYGGEVCVAISAGVALPEWAVSGLPQLPDLMAESGRRSSKFERGTVNLVEALVLSPHLGHDFTGTLIEVEPDDDDGVLQLNTPAVQARIKGSGLVLGCEVTATLVAADLLDGDVEFRIL